MEMTFLLLMGMCSTGSSGRENDVWKCANTWKKNKNQMILMLNSLQQGGLVKMWKRQYLFSYTHTQA